MSRLDDLRKKEKELLQQIAAWEKDCTELREYMNRPGFDKEYFSRELKEEQQYAQRDRNRLVAVRKDIAEEEKRIAAEKAKQVQPRSFTHSVSRRDSDHDTSKRVCGRCGRPMGPTQVVCYNCLSIGSVKS